MATDEKAEFDDEGLCVYPLSKSRIRRNVEASASTSNQTAFDQANMRNRRDETPPPSDAAIPFPVANPNWHYKDNDACSCGSGTTKCCRDCCEVESHWLVSDSSDEVESDYSCYNDKPDHEPDPDPGQEGEDPEVVDETVELEEDGDEIEVVMDFIDLTYNNNPQIQFHPAPTPTPPPQCPCRSPPGPLATSTPKKPKLE